MENSEALFSRREQFWQFSMSLPLTERRPNYRAWESVVCSLHFPQDSVAASSFYLCSPPPPCLCVYTLWIEGHTVWAKSIFNRNARKVLFLMASKKANTAEASFMGISNLDLWKAIPLSKKKALRWCLLLHFVLFKVNTSRRAYQKLCCLRK